MKFSKDDYIKSVRVKVIMAYQYFDEQIREYLLFRGFVSTLKAFDADIKSEKEKGLRADK